MQRTNFIKPTISTTPNIGQLQYLQTPLVQRQQDTRLFLTPDSTNETNGPIYLYPSYPVPVNSSASRNYNALTPIETYTAADLPLTVRLSAKNSIALSDQKHIDRAPNKNTALQKIQSIDLAAIILSAVNNLRENLQHAVTHPTESMQKLIGALGQISDNIAKRISQSLTIKPKQKDKDENQGSLFQKIKKLPDDIFQKIKKTAGLNTKQEAETTQEAPNKDQVKEAPLEILPKAEEVVNAQPQEQTVYKAADFSDKLSSQEEQDKAGLEEYKQKLKNLKNLKKASKTASQEKQKHKAASDEIKVAPQIQTEEESEKKKDLSNGEGSIQAEETVLANTVAERQDAEKAGFEEYKNQVKNRIPKWKVKSQETAQETPIQDDIEALFTAENAPDTLDQIT